ncbi:hypothetical protein BPORC_1209 [Bifidobacterium porcinum]|nr:hypothetical protein BPORC_1209 [Bifidobacterium porcinum]
MLPGEVPDPHETRINSRTGHGSSARIRHSADNLPTGTLEIRGSEKPTNKPRPGEQRRIHASAMNSRENPGHHPQTTDFPTNSHTTVLDIITRKPVQR